MHKSRVLRISAISAILFAALFIVIIRRSEFSLFAQSTSSSAPVAKDQDGLNSVWVMVVEDGVNIAGMGGLMGTAMSSRGYSGAVIDGGVRDLGQLRKIGFPVFALGVVPSTSVHHYRFAGSNVPLVCDGVDVQPGDIISADNDGVVVVPRARAEEVLA